MGKREGGGSEGAVSGNCVLMVAGQRVEDGGVLEIASKTLELQTRFLSDPRDHLGVVYIEPVLVPSGQQAGMEGGEAILSSGRLRGFESEPAAHLLGRGGSPRRPAHLFRVHLGEREICPPHVSWALASHAREQQ